jgi:Histidine kinase-, DNA gyrase B-, and HSP90-like ATPase
MNSRGAGTGVNPLALVSTFVDPRTRRVWSSTACSTGPEGTLGGGVWPSTIGWMVAGKVRLRIGNVAKAVLVSGQAYQDPKDALNEFVSNAADEYIELGTPGRVRVLLRRRGRSPVIAIDDDGRGMSQDRLREVARNLFESVKAGDSRTLGEKAIGMLAYQQIGGRVDVVSRTEDSTETWVLRLERGSVNAHLDRERRRVRASPGTTVYIADLDPDVARVLTQRKVVDYLRSRRAAALTAGLYSIEVVEGKNVELVTPERPDGIRLEIPARQTLWGKVDFALYVAPADGRRRRVAVVGRAGTTILDDLAEIDEFDIAPWTSDQVSGRIVFDALVQSAGRRSVLRDRDAFPMFVEIVRSVEAAVAATVEKVTRNVDDATTDRLADTVRSGPQRARRSRQPDAHPARQRAG